MDFTIGHHFKSGADGAHFITRNASRWPRPGSPIQVVSLGHCAGFLLSQGAGQSERRQDTERQICACCIRSWSQSSSHFAVCLRLGSLPLDGLSQELPASVAARSEVPQYSKFSEG